MINHSPQFHIKAPNEHGALQFARGLYDDKENSTSHVFEYELCSVIALIDAPSKCVCVHARVSFIGILIIGIIDCSIKKTAAYIQ